MRIPLHLGLVYLHELAQDDEGMMREMARADDAIRDYAMKYSIENCDATPSRPYNPNGG